MNVDVTLGLDVGTTAVKAGLVDSTGQLLASFRAQYPISRPQPGYAEQDPEAWVALIGQALDQFASQGFGADCAAIGLCSQVNTHVFVGHDGRALIPAILWQDGRAGAEARALDAMITPAQKLAWWGAYLPIDASHPLARILWVARHLPQVWQQTRWVMAPKDYCLHRLTGQIASDPLSNFPLVDTAGHYIPELLALVPGAAERVVPLRAITEVIGIVTRPGRFAGVPVVTGTMDAWTGLLGAGGAGQGTSVYLSGTSEILGVTSAAVHPTPGVVVFPETAGLRIHAGPTQSGGAAVEWFCQMAGIAPADMSALAALSDRQRPAPLFLPHLQGERAPIWNPDLRGAFLGLNAQTGLPDLARAVFEGVAFSARMVLDALEQSSGRANAVINCGGGGFQSPTWNQIRADVLGRSLRRLSVKDPGIVGAAGLAAMGAGLAPDLASALQQRLRFEVTFDPDSGQSARYDHIFGLYSDAIAANTELNRRLAGLQGAP